jgi:hypothetical protein
MQRIGVGVLVAAAAVVAWITLGPAGEEGDAADAPSVSSAADPFDPIRRAPALVLGRIDREADPLAGGSDDPVADAGSSPEDSAPDPRSTGGGEYGMTGGGGEGPSRPTAEGRPPTNTADPASAPINPLAPPADLPSDAPSDASDPGAAPVNPAELADLEANAARYAEQLGLIDEQALDARARAAAGPDATPADIAGERQEILATLAIVHHRTTEEFGPDLPPNELKARMDTGEQIQAWQPPEWRIQQLEEIEPVGHGSGLSVGSGDRAEKLMHQVGGGHAGDDSGGS